MRTGASGEGLCRGPPPLGVESSSLLGLGVKMQTRAGAFAYACSALMRCCAHLAVVYVRYVLGRCCVLC
ncbi:hypothetical protein NDU88_006156 [Pleurodeles waltl]|uniref:Uncharacterized protein n=1 Tax=Pleurodeles waltl TaxID=8319 RepID=A0AAV7L4Q2_PLEWA|nr:hypothetical protein NDU88_006156 [Pleurodeles waltl]